MNSVEVVHNTESEGRALHAVELQYGKSGAFVFVFIFATLFCTILNCFYPNGLSLTGGFLIQFMSKISWIQTQFITFMCKTCSGEFWGHLYSGFVDAWGTDYCKEIKTVFHHLYGTT